MKSSAEIKCLKLNPKLRTILDQKINLYAIANAKGYIVSDWFKHQEDAWKQVADNLGI
jgi:hypothetical protein